MIVTVTPNPALDVTYEVDKLQLGGEHRVRAVHERPGGKGINVARILSSLGHRTLATGLTIGATGRAMTAALQEFDVPEAFLQLDDSGRGHTRRTVVVHDGLATTSFYEPGPRLIAADAKALIEHVRALVGGATALVISGSLPPGLPDDTVARLASLAHDHGIPAVVDTAVMLALAAKTGAVLNPNRAELAIAVGVPDLPTLTDVVEAARHLVSEGANALVVTLGSEGMVAVTKDAVLRSRPPTVLSGNPTGAGDACAAALTARLATACAAGKAVDWHATLVEATALSAAALLRPVAGEVDREAYERWKTEIEITA